MLLQATMWAAIITLYIGIAGAVGLFSRHALIGRQVARDRLLAAIYSLALFLPATALIMAMVETPYLTALLALALVSLLAALLQPSWMPKFLWHRTFTHHYLASVMALAALWGIAQAQGGSSAAPLLITISAVAAAAASSGATLKAPSIDAP